LSFTLHFVNQTTPNMFLAVFFHLRHEVYYLCQNDEFIDLVYGEIMNRQ
jgi:hypothetical protein